MATDISKADLAKLLESVTVNQTDLTAKLQELMKSNEQLHAAISGGGLKLSDLTTATKRVFDTPELAEAIFEQCDFKDLLIAQRVCQNFKQIVRTSITLRRKLHLAPLQADGMTLLPALLRHIKVTRSLAPGTNEPRVWIEIMLEQAKEERSPLTGLFIHPSWESMSLTQPPPQELTYFLRCSNTSGPGKERELSSADGLGITLIQMQRAAQAWDNEHLKVGCRYKVCKPGQEKDAYFKIRPSWTASTTSS